MIMRRVVLYIASSLDGYIARTSGEVDWLFTDQDYGYADFLAGVDTILMGRRTYEQACHLVNIHTRASRASYSHELKKKGVMRT